MRYFLAEHDRRTSRTEWTDFDEADKALRALSVKEAARLPHIEVVLFVAESLDQLRVTHSRFFMGPRELIARTAPEDRPADIAGLADLAEELRKAIA